MMESECEHGEIKDVELGGGETEIFSVLCLNRNVLKL